MLTLYHNDMSVCAQKVRIVLAELGLEWESHHLKLRGDEQFQPAFLRLNPKGQVPVLDDDGVVIPDSNVINEYLVESRAPGSLMPPTPAGRARVRFWTRQLDENVHLSTGVMSQSIAFLHQYLANTPDMVEHILSSAPDEWRRTLKRNAFGKGLANPDLPPACRRMDRLLGDMDAALATSAWVAGEAYTLADAGFTPYVLRMEHLQMAPMFEGRPHLRDWWARVQARPSYALGIGRWMNPDYVTLTARTGAEARPLVADMLRAA